MSNNSETNYDSEAEADAEALATAEMEATLKKAPKKKQAATETSEDADSDSPTESSADLEAGAKGWVPKEKYKGDPDKWVDADTFLDRGKNFTKALQRKIADLERQAEDFQGTKAAFAKFQAESLAAKEAEISALIRVLKRDRNEAIRNGEDSEAEAYEDRITRAEHNREVTKQAFEQVTAPPQQAAQQIDPVLSTWIEENPWYGDSPKMQAYCNEIGQELKAKGDKSFGAAFLAKVKAIVMEDFPQKFKNENRDRAGAVESNTRNGASAAIGSPGRRAADLPASDRALMRKFVSEGYMTENQFLKDYQWS